MRTLFFAGCFVLGSVFWSPPAGAAVVEVWPSTTMLLNPDFSAVTDEMIRGDGRLALRDDYYIISVSVSMRIYDLQPGQVGFSNTAFNVEVLGDGEAYSDVSLGIPSWYPFTALYCETPPQLRCPLPVWDMNDDYGIDRNDLQAIILSGITKGFGPPEYDTRRTLGQDEDGDMAGSFFIKLPGTPGATAFAETLTPWGASTYDENGFSTTAGNTAIGGRTQTFVVVPEPSSGYLLLLCALLTILRIRRTAVFAASLVAACTLSPASAEAAIVEVSPEAVAVVEMDFLPVDESFIVAPGRLRPREEPYLIQVGVRMRIRDLQPGQVGFSNTAFNAQVQGDGVAFNMPDLGLPPWSPHNPPLDVTGPFPGINIFLWDINADAGQHADDLQSVLLAGATRFYRNAAWDVRPNLGKSAEGELAGTFYIQLPATAGAWTFAETLTPWGASTYDADGFSTTAGNTAVGGRTITFEVVPEPASMILFAVAMLPIAFCLRRRVRVIAITGVLAFSLAESVDAALVTVTPRVTGVLNPDFSPVDCRDVFGECNYNVVPQRLRPRDEAYLILVDVWMHISDLQPGQVGFSNTAFNGAAGGDGEIYFDAALGIAAWIPDNPSWDPCGPVWSCFSKWDINSDDGYPNDLQGVILAGITRGFGPPQFDTRRTLGQGPDGDHAGTFYIQLPATAGAWTFGDITTPWGASTYDENGFSTTAGNTAIGGRTERIVIAPEPSAVTLAVLAAGLMGAGIRRCGTTPTRQSPAPCLVAGRRDGWSCR